MPKPKSPIEFRKNKNGNPYYVVKARNGKILTISESFNTNRAALTGAKALFRTLFNSAGFLNSPGGLNTLKPSTIYGTRN